MPSPFLSLYDVYKTGERNFQRFYLQNVKLKGLLLKDIDLTEADLTGADLEGADLSGAILKGAIMKGANLKFVNLRKVDFSDANLTEANMEGTDLTEAVMSRAILRRVNLDHANLTRAHLVSVQGEGELVDGSDSDSGIHCASFQEAIARDANLSDANLRFGNFQGADLRGARLLRADLSEIEASPIKLLSGSTKIMQLAGADLSLACLRKSQIMGDFHSANLSQADLREAEILGDFREANLSDALFWKTTLTGSNFTHSNLSGTNLVNCKLNKCLMPNGKPAGWDLEKFSGKPPSPTAKGVIRKPPVYTEFWFDSYEKVKTLRWPAMCVCCCRTFERYERLMRAATSSNHLPYHELRAPYCTACLQHHIRSRNVENWMKTVCTAQGGKTPAVKFESKKRGIFAGQLNYVLSFSSMEYAISFSASNLIPFQGPKNFSNFN